MADVQNGELDTSVPTQYRCTNQRGDRVDRGRGRRDPGGQECDGSETTTLMRAQKLTPVHEDGTSDAQDDGHGDGVRPRLEDDRPATKGEGAGRRRY